ncbi:MAG: hypothetical protein KAU20_07675 [Nanoarchaeota archaeon]|nr:hypothetical protein [Nanoarchaeota archaeon]
MNNAQSWFLVLLIIIFAAPSLIMSFKIMLEAWEELKETLKKLKAREQS